MHAKPPQDGTAPAVLWLEAIKTRYSGGPVAEEVMAQRTKPPFRADHVGSLLRPAALKEAREKRARGEISQAELKAVEDREIERAISKQEEVGLRAVTDGEFRRSWWHRRRSIVPGLSVLEATRRRPPSAAASWRPRISRTGSFRL